MNKRLLLVVCPVLLYACSGKKADEQVIIEKPAVNITDGQFTPEILWSLGRLGEMTVSPDGKQIAYTLTYTDIKQNKSNAEIYIMSVNGGEATRLTKTAESEFNPVWKDNNNLLFCRDDKLISINIKTKDEMTLGVFENGIEGFRLAPDGKSIVYITTIPVKRPPHIDKLYEGLSKTTGRINEDLMYRHWDQWVDDYPQIFIAKFDGTIDIEHSTSIIDSTFECPIRPFGGIEQFNYSPDSKMIVYTCRKKTGYDYAISTNSDIYIYDIENGTTINISKDNTGYDQNPVFSHDGTMIAWESMERDGYESDKQRLVIYELATGTLSDLTTDFDYSVSNIAWSDDDNELFAIVPFRGMEEIFSFNRSTNSIRQITHGYHDITSFELKGENIIATQASMQYPNEIFAYLTKDEKSEGKKLSTYNDDILGQVKMGKVEEHWIKTVDGKDMLTWLIYPYDYDSTKTYPVLLFCEGGPQSMVSQFWSLRWNFEVMSGAGYFVIAPNRRGCIGFGSEWCEEVSGDYGGLCMKDYISAADYFTKNTKQIDANRLGACGASFGGFSIFWLAGHNEDHRFKVFLAHNGMFNFEQEFLETEELWCDLWEYGGPYWDKSPRVQKSYAESPHRFVDRWNTPICVIHSELDYRIAASQGMAAYNAAKLRGIEARYLYFPDESHWVQKPQNSILWHRNFIDWFDKHLK